MSEIDADKVRELITDLGNRAMGQLPRGASVTMVVRMPPEEGHCEEFIITNENDPMNIVAMLLKLRPGDHPDVVSDTKVPIEPTPGGLEGCLRDTLEGCIPDCLAPIYRAPIHHAPGCPNEEA